MRGGGSVEPGLNYLKVGGGHNVVGENTLATTSTQYYWKIFQYQIFVTTSSDNNTPVTMLQLALAPRF